MSHPLAMKKLRHPHHSNVNLKPAAMLDHLKIKVKQRCSSHRQANDGNDGDTDDEGHENNRHRHPKTKSNDNPRRRRKARPTHIDSQEAQMKFCLNGIEIDQSTETSEDSPVLDNHIPPSMTTTTMTDEIDLTVPTRTSSQSFSTAAEPTAQMLTNIASSLPSCHFSVSSFNLGL